MLEIVPCRLCKCIAGEWTDFPWYYCYYYVLYRGLTLHNSVTNNAVGICACLSLICEVALEGHIRDSGVFPGYAIV